MQTVDVTVLNRGFRGYFLGAALVRGLAIGGMLCLGGSFAVTVAANLPRVGALTALAADSAWAAPAWRVHRRDVVAWNLVRTKCCVATAVVSLPIV